MIFFRQSLKGKIEWIDFIWICIQLAKKLKESEGMSNKIYDSGYPLGNVESGGVGEEHTVAYIEW